MKNLYTILLQALLCALLTISVNASTPVNVTFTTAPNTLATCDTNIFTATFTLTTPSILRIHDTITFANYYYNSCHGNGGNNFTALKLFNPSSLNFYHDMTNHTWNIHLAVGTHTISYYVFIDCGVVVPDNDTTQNLNFIQTWTDSLNSTTINYVLTNGNSDSRPVLSPSIVDVSNNIAEQHFYGSYLDTVYEYSTYFNYGSADAHIRFMFDPNPPGNCATDTNVIAIDYATGDTSNLTYQPLNVSAWNPAIILMNKALRIRKTEIIYGCIDTTCLHQTVNFRWKCNYTDTIIPFCDKCQNEYLGARKYSLLQNFSDTLGVSVNLIHPSSQVADYDNSCMNSTLQWEYHIVNGKRNVPFARIDLFDGSPFLYSWSQSYLTLIDTTSLHIYTYCGNCFSHDTIFYNPTALCHAAINNAFGKLIVYLKDFMKGDSVVIQYQTYRCCAENDSALLNHYKYYNKWFLSATVKDTCGNSASANGKMSSNVSAPNADFDQTLNFFPTVTDLTVPHDSIWGPATPLLHVLLKGMMGDSTDYQFVGCSAYPNTCTMKGYLRARIHCQKGLVVDTPYTHVKITGTNGSQLLTWNPVYFSTTLDTLKCDSANYYFFFNLSDPNAFALINNGSFDFRLWSCCYSGLDKSLYDIAFHLIALPSAGCDSCALPMSSTGDGIKVHCPGCISPGIIVDNYNIQRISFSDKDSNNNGFADTTIALIDSSYYSNFHNQLNTFTAHHNDLLEDRMLAHFQKGDSAMGGYTYVQMLDSNVHLKYLQMERSFKIGKDSVQVKLTPYYIKLYIDTPVTAIDTNCIDCNQYDSNHLFRTVQIIADSATVLDTTYIQTDTTRRSLFFTFGAEDTSSNLFHHILFSDNIRPFHGFGEGQRYRLLVRYHICGYFSPPLLYPTPDDFLKKAEIDNYMFLSGQRQGTDATSQIDLATDTLPSPLYQSFADMHLFKCETFGGRFYLYSDQTFNGSGFGITNNNKCHKQINIACSATTGSASYQNPIYPYEYRLSAFEPAQFKIKIPTGYTASYANYFSSYFSATGQPYFSYPRTISVTPSGDSLTIDAASLLSMTCANENITYNYYDSTLYINQDERILYINIPLQTAICNPDSLYVFDSSNVIIRFRENTLQCAGGLTQGCDAIVFDQTISNFDKSKDTLRLPHPNLLMSMTPFQTDGFKHRVCWTFQFSNINDDAYNVFISVPQSTNLTNWYIYMNNSIGSYIYPDPHNIFDVAPVMNTYFTQDDSLCATFINCNPDTVLSIYYGWDCNGYPDSASAMVCFKDTLALKITLQPAIITPQVVPPPSTYDLCQPFSLAATYLSKSSGFIYPQQFLLNGLDPHFQVNSVYMFTCTDSLDSVALIPTASPSIWNITAATLDSIGIKDSSLTGSECLYIEAFVEPLCGSDNVLHLPSLELISLKYCSDILYSNAKFDTLSNTVTYSGMTHCTNCFTLTKTALQDTVAVGDTATFQIIICGNNADTEIVNLTEYLPLYFDTLPGSVIPPTDTLFGQQCDTILVSGTFNTTGNCPAVTNIVQIKNNYIDTTASACVTVVQPLSPCIALADTVIADSSFTSSFGFNSFNNDTVFIAGRLYVNTPLFTFNSCLVYMGTGAQIIVMPFDTLITVNSIITGCTNMWKGIYLNNSSVYYQYKGTYLHDANWGVYANDKSKFFIEGKTGILDCVRGIYTPQSSGGMNNIFGDVRFCQFGLFASAFKPDYPTQPPHGILPYAGIDLNDMVMTIGSDSSGQNQFYHLNNGVVARRSRITINNSEFSKVKTDTYYLDKFRGTAMVSVGKFGSVKGSLIVNPVKSGLSTVFNSHRGVYTDYSYLTVIGVDFTDMNIGLYSTYCTDQMKTLISACTITADQFGIKWETNTNTGGMTAEYNTISINSPTAKGIYLSETNNSYPVLYFLNTNRIIADSATYGIIARIAHKPNIYGNIITIRGKSSAFAITEGISIQHCDGASVTCNTVKAEYPVSSNKRARGIGTHESLHSFIGCNSTDSTYRGIFFGGLCTGTQLKGNNMRTHFDGLRLNTTAIIDTQSWGGNRWYGPFTYFGAVDSNYTPTFNLYSSELLIDPIDSTYLPSIPGFDNAWITPFPGNTFSCSSPLYSVCGSTRTDDKGSDALKRKIAKDSIDTRQFPDESQIKANFYLYDVLQTDTILLASDTTFQNFLARNVTHAVGYLYDAKAKLKSAATYDSSLTIFIISKDSLIKIQTDSIAYIDSLTSADSTVNYSLARQANVDQITAIQQVVKDSLDQRKISVDAKVTSAETKNNLAQPVGLPDENEKFINTMEIILQKQGIDSLLQYYLQILDIAQQCPYAGGGAVYRARAIIEMMDISIDYDDETVCTNLGIDRQGKSFDNTAKGDIQIIPNPADYKVIIILRGTQEGICQIEISNAVGEIILKDEMNCKEKSHSINTRNFVSGVYFVKVHLNNSPLKIAKLIIER